MRTTPLTLRLDRDRRFAWSNSTIYRLQCVRLKPEGTYGTMVAMLWACLVPADAADFPTPEHVAQHLAPENKEQMQAALELVDKLTASRVPVEAKNADGSTPSPSPASS